MPSRRTFLRTILLAPFVAPVARAFKPKPTVNFIALLNQMCAVNKQRLSSGASFDILTDRETADKFRKAHARQMWYYHHHVQRKRRWTATLSPDQLNGVYAVEDYHA